MGSFFINFPIQWITASRQRSVISENLTKIKLKNLTIEHFGENYRYLYFFGITYIIHFILDMLIIQNIHFIKIYKIYYVHFIQFCNRTITAPYYRIAQSSAFHSIYFCRHYLLMGYILYRKYFLTFVQENRQRWYRLTYMFCFQNIYNANDFSIAQTAV